MQTVTAQEANRLSSKENTRNYGVDLLRIVAMLYVVILHSVGPGGILNTAAVDSVQYKLAWFMETWTFCAVNIFALISGYVSYTERDRKTTWTSYILLWMQVVFYGVAVTLVFNHFHPELVTKKDLLLTLFPVTNGLYWYLNAYTGLFVVLPLLNAGLRKCPEQTLRKLFVVLFVVFSVYEVAIRQLELVSGYSFVWVTVLYIMGAIIRKCDIGKDLSFSQTLIGTAVLCFTAWFWKMYGADFHIGGFSVTKGMLVSYISPMILGAGILHLIGFSKLRLQGWLQKVIAFAAPAAFAVYILNCHRIIWAHMVAEKFVSLATRPVHIMVFWVLAFSAAFLVLGILIDRVRILLFAVFRVRRIVDFVVAMVERAVAKIADRL